MRTELESQIRIRRAEPFPSETRGEQYGEVDAVMIDADIIGWASQAEALSEMELRGLDRARAELERSLDKFPLGARSHFQRLLNIARLALAR